MKGFFTYTDSIGFLKNKREPSEIKTFVLNALISDFKFYANSNDKKTLKFNSPFLKIPFSISLKVSGEELLYTLYFDNTVKIIIAVTVFLAVFMYSSLNVFFISSSLFAFLFYVINLTAVNSYVNNLLVKILKDINVIAENAEILSDLQKEWIKDENRCSACGEYLSDLDLICPECGINLKRNKNKIPSDITVKNIPYIRYHIKKK